MTYTIPVLDHGFVKLRNLSGPTRRIMSSFDADDTDPANAARMSFDQTDSGRTREEDLRLADYLMRNKHTTPFEMVEVWVEMKMPIFVARQFVRHRTVSINEVSARYVTLPEEWYIPAPATVGIKPVKAKQGRDLVPWEEMDNDQKMVIERYRDNLHLNCQISYKDYLWAIENGVPPELARLNLHVNHYTHWLWKQDLHNMMHFLMLRDHSHAQYEAQAYAKAIDGLIRGVLPHSMALYDQYRRMPG